MPVYLFEMKLGCQLDRSMAKGVQLDSPVDKQDQQQCSSRLFAHMMYAHLKPNKQRNKQKTKHTHTDKSPLIKV